VCESVSGCSWAVPDLLEVNHGVSTSKNNNDPVMMNI